MDTIQASDTETKQESAAPNPAHYADLATWRDAILEWEHKMLTDAAGISCCTDDEKTIGERE